MRGATISIAAFGFMIAVGCGGDDDGGGGGGDDVALTEASEADLTALCDEAAARADSGETQTLLCHVLALSFGGDDCEATVADCLAAEEEPGQDPAEDCTLADLPACAADVGLDEMAICMDAIYDAIAAAAEVVSCDSTLEEAQGPLAGLPDECAGIEERCPALIRDDDA